MIFVDANIILRALTRSSQPDVQHRCRLAVDLFRRADRGEVEFTTSDAIIAETAFILTASAHYNLTVEEAAERLSALLARGFRSRQKPVLLHALDLCVKHPKLGFVDTLAAAYAQHANVELATFDQDFDRFTDIARRRPDGGPT